MTLKLSQLVPVAKYYQERLAWGSIDKNVIMRVSAPFAQGIIFDRASDDTYRPITFLSILVAPLLVKGSLEFPQFLARKGGDWSIRLRDHDRDRDQVFEEMLRQFQPMLAKPLDPVECEAICRQRAKPWEAYKLAAVAAYYGRAGETRRQCKYFHEAMQRFPKSPADSERTRFVEELLRRLDQGDVQNWLNDLMLKNKSELGLK